MKFSYIPGLLLTAAVLASCGSQPYKKETGGIVVNVGKKNESDVNKVRLQVYGDKIIRVTATPDSKFAPDASLSVLERPNDVKFDVEESDSSFPLLTSAHRDNV